MSIGKGLRVVHITHDDHGGAGTAARRLHAGLRAMGVDSRVIAASLTHDDPTASLANPARGSAVRRGRGRCNPEFDDAVTAWKALVEQYPNRIRGYEMFSSPVGTFPAIATAIPDDADILHFHWVCGMIPFDVPQQWLEKYRIVWTLHDMNPFTGGCHFSNGCDRFKGTCGNCPQLGGGENDHSRTIHEQKRQSYSRLDITCVSPCAWMRDRAAESSLLSGVRHEVVHNGVDLENFRRDETVRERDGRFADDEFVLLFGAAHGSDRKGGAVLDEALRILSRDVDCSRLRLATFGDAGEIDNLPVTSFGYVEDEGRMAEIYSMADAVLLPSREDNFPNVVLESLACGTPVVAFAVGGVPEQIDHEGTGYLASPADPADLVRGMRWAMGRKLQRKDTARACREWAESRFDVFTKAKDMVAVYESVLL